MSFSEYDDDDLLMIHSFNGFSRFLYCMCFSFLSFIIISVIVAFNIDISIYGYKDMLSNKKKFLYLYYMSQMLCLNSYMFMS